MKKNNNLFKLTDTVKKILIIYTLYMIFLSILYGFWVIFMSNVATIIMMSIIFYKRKLKKLKKRLDEILNEGKK